MTQHPSRIALVLGVNGGIGGETAAALARHGWTIRALVRDPAKGVQRPDWSYVAGDVMDRASVIEAAKGVGIIVHAVNPPGYRDWARLVLPMMDNSIAAAQASGARILLPGTIYNYDPGAHPVLAEATPQRPRTAKGKIRVAMEARLEAAGARGVRSLILRAGDFFGPRPGNNWFSQAMVTPGKPLKAITYPGKIGVGHGWAYLPDVAETFAQLADREAELPVFARFHFEGLWDATGETLTSAVARTAGDSTLPVKPLPWTLLALMSPFDTTLRELVDMKRFWRQPARLNNQGLVAFLGREPRTPLGQALETTLAGLKVRAPNRRRDRPNTRGPNDRRLAATRSIGLA